jgi:hypothetical protein
MHCLCEIKKEKSGKGQKEVLKNKEPDFIILRTGYLF